MPVVRVGAAVAALGSLLALILGVSRTTLAMARDRHLPGALAAVHPRFQVPHRAELAVGAVVAVLAATVDVRGAIGFSSFGVLAYYAVANASRLDASPLSGRCRRWAPRLCGAGVRAAGISVAGGACWRWASRRRCAARSVRWAGRAGPARSAWPTRSSSHRSASDRGVGTLSVVSLLVLVMGS